MTTQLILLPLVLLLVYAVYECTAGVECKDLLNKNNAIILPNGKKLKNCATLVKKYLYLCRKHGQEGERCCKSCKGKDLSCLDNPFYKINGKKCRKYVKKNPFGCGVPAIEEECCASCEKVKPDKDCKDNPDFVSTVTVIIEGKEKVCKNCDCEDIKNKGKDTSFAAVACGDKDIMKECCAMCNMVG